MTDFKAVLDSLPGVVYVADPENYEIRYVNDAVSDIYGYSAEQWMARPSLWLEIIHPDDRKRAFEEKEELKLKRDCVIEYRVLHKDGTTRWVSDRFVVKKDANGEIESISGILSDITAYKSEREYSQKIIDELLDESATVIYRCEASGKFPATFISNNIKRQLNYEPDDFIKNPDFWANNIHPADREYVFSGLGSLFEKGQHSHEYRFRHGDGHYVWMHDELRITHDENGQIKDIVGNWVDVSKTKKLELGIQHAQKMQAIGTLAGGVAHEFNNMLGVIIGFTELMSSLSGMPAKATDYISHVLDAANRSKELVQQLLSMSQINHKNIEVVDLCARLKSEVEFLKSSFPSSVIFQINENINCKPVGIDGDEFRQILVNLVSNAVYAMHNKGVISISLDSVTVNGIAASQSMQLAEGKYVKVSVSDTGEGMDEEVKRRIFEPFFTTKPTGDGTGMGMALVYSMLDAYGGRIKVITEKGNGSTFELFFPVVSDAGVEYQYEESESVSGRAKRDLKVLFVDDELLFVELCEAILTAHGFEVDLCSSSQDALARFQSNPYAYDLLISDQIMPGLLGTELSDLVLKIRPDMKIILCTGFGIDSAVASSYGIKGFITKPFTYEAFVREIERVVNSEN